MSFANVNAPTPGYMRTLDMADRRALVMKLLNAGNPISVIAATMQITESQTRTAIRTALRQQPAEDVEGWRAIELARLENAHRMVMAKIEAKLNATGDPEDLDLRSVDRLLTIAQRRAKLLGLDMPVKLEIEQGVPTRIIEVAAWPTDRAGQAIAAPDSGVDEPEADHRDGGGDGIRKDMVRTDLAS